MRGSTISPAGRRRLVRGALVLLVAGGLLAASRWSATRRKPAAGAVPLLEPAALTVVPGVHLLGSLDPAAAYAVETADGLVLVDAGLEPDAGLLKQQLAYLGLDWKRLRAILLTHAHIDHSGGAEHLRSATGAKVYAGRDDAAVLRAGQPREAFVSSFHMPDVHPRPTTVDVEVLGGEVIEVGGVRFRALALAGHTPGSVCYLMERDGRRVLFSGDVIVALAGDQNSPGRVANPLGTYSAYLAPRYRGDARAYLTSLRTLRSMPVPDLVLPGHPRQDSTPQSPVLSQQRWEALLDAGIRDMQTLLARYERDEANFLDGTPKRLLPGLWYLGDFKGSAVYGLMAGGKLFAVDAPGGPGLVDFWNARLRAFGPTPAVPAAILLTSCGPEATAGLAELAGQGRPEVVAAADGLRAVRAACPVGTVVVAADELPRRGWFDVKAIPLRGRGPGPVAYEVRWAGKTVLFSGRIPIEVSEPAVERLRQDFRDGGNRLHYFDSLDRLARVKPDLWLPAVPADGQNANLYDREWAALLEANRRKVFEEQGPSAH